MGNAKIEFNAKCPACDRWMAKGNKYCCLECYKEENK